MKLVTCGSAVHYTNNKGMPLCGQPGEFSEVKPPIWKVDCKKCIRKVAR